MPDKMAGKPLTSNIACARNQWYSKDSVFWLAQRRCALYRDVISRLLSEHRFSFQAFCRYANCTVRCFNRPTICDVCRPEEGVGWPEDSQEPGPESQQHRACRDQLSRYAHSFFQANLGPKYDPVANRKKYILFPIQIENFSNSWFKKVHWEMTLLE